MTLHEWLGLAVIVAAIVISIRYTAWNESNLDRMHQKMKWAKDATPPFDAIVFSRSKRGSH